MKLEVTITGPVEKKYLRIFKRRQMCFYNTSNFFCIGVVFHVMGIDFVGEAFLS